MIFFEKKDANVLPVQNLALPLYSLSVSNAATPATDSAIDP